MFNYPVSLHKLIHFMNVNIHNDSTDTVITEVKIND